MERGSCPSKKVCIVTVSTHQVCDPLELYSQSQDEAEHYPSTSRECNLCVVFVAWKGRKAEGE